MKIYSMVAERKTLIQALGEYLNAKPEYLGAPTFCYQVGEYKVMKDGSIEVSDEKADIKMLRTLHTKGMIDASWDEEREVMEIKLPYDGHTGVSLMNLTFMLASKCRLVNKSIRCINAFSVNDRFIELLQEKVPISVEAFLQVEEEVDANGVNTGIIFDVDNICFTGFPVTTEPELVKAYMDLVELMNKMSKEVKRVQPTSISSDNEKYAFRVWLLRLGMKGEAYKTTRKVLLENLSGNSAFRTEEQAEAFRASRRVEKAEE